MTKGQQVIATAEKDLGCHESPMGSNDGACVNALQSSTGAFNVAWCASAVSTWWKRAGIDVSHLATASTFQLVENGRDLHDLRDAPIQGCAVVWRPGSNGHTELFIRWVVQGSTALTIGGNTGDAVREHQRDVRGAFFVVPRELVPVHVYALRYQWEDRDAKPEAHGPWATINSQEKAIAEWVRENGNPGHVRKTNPYVRKGLRRVKRYGFLTGQRRYSPEFATRAERDRDMKKTERERPGHRFRTSSKRVQIS